MKVDELNDSIYTLVTLPTSSLVPSKIPLLLLPSSTHVKVMYLANGGNSNSESTKSDEVSKKNTKIEKGQESSKIVS